LWSDEETITGRVIDVSAFGICIAVAPTTLLRVGKVHTVEILRATADRFRWSREVRCLHGNHLGLETAGLEPSRQDLCGV